MFHGDIVSMTLNTVEARAKALQPLGIYDKSICWGMWAANPHKLVDGRANPLYWHPNLLISPFHPSSWPFLVRIRLILENRKGALAEAAKLLEENDLSILFAECTPTGFSHATWTVIAESTWGKLDDLRKRKQQFDLDNPTVRLPPSREYDQARDLANSIAAHMLTHVRKLETVFNEVKSNRGRSPLLHEWHADSNSHFLYNGDAVAREMQELQPGSQGTNLGYINSQIPDPATVNYMQRLAYFAVYGGGGRREVPFKFEYAAETKLITLLTPVDFESGSFKLAPLPMPAIGTFNSEEKYLRLCPVMPPLLDPSQLSHINVRYAVGRQPTYNAKASQGLLRLICDELLRADIDLLHVSNKWTKHAYFDQAGMLSFIAGVDQNRREQLEEKLQSSNDAGPEHLKEVSIKYAKVHPYPRRHLFLSIHLRGEHPREADIKELVKKIAVQEGFAKVVVVEDYIDSAIEAVRREIKACQAFLQVLYLNDGQEREGADFEWLDKEYVMASMISGLRIVRLVDLARAPYEWWKARDKTSQDHHPMAFRTDVSDQRLSKYIRDAVRMLAKQLEPPSQTP